MTDRRPPTAIAVAIAATFVLPAEADATEKGTPMTITATSATTAPPSLHAPVHARAVVDFWRAAGPGLWFAKDTEFDRRFRERFLWLYLAATRGELADWSKTPEGAMALVILLDQFPRNAFRNTPRMYATDAMARKIADAALKAGHGQAVEPALRLFFYLPFGHSENLADQERPWRSAKPWASPICRTPSATATSSERFGRFPHRNPILGRAMTPEEQRYLDEGGYAG